MVNHKRALKIHVETINFVKNYETQPTFSVFHTGLAITSQMSLKHVIWPNIVLKIVVKESLEMNKFYIQSKQVFPLSNLQLRMVFRVDSRMQSVKKRL